MRWTKQKCYLGYRRATKMFALFPIRVGVTSKIQRNYLWLEYYWCLEEYKEVMLFDPVIGAIPSRKWVVVDRQPIENEEENVNS